MTEEQEMLNIALQACLNAAVREAENKLPTLLAAERVPFVIALLCINVGMDQQDTRDFLRRLGLSLPPVA